jgi:hypothetical protein
MSSRAHGRSDLRAPVLAILALLAVSGCSGLGDYGRLHPDLQSDFIHDWVGRDAASSVGAPVSNYYLTEDERTLRDLAFPLIEPPYDRQRWDAVISEYGINREVRHGPWAESRTFYFAQLEAVDFRSSTARYNRLIDDIRNDIVRIEPFFLVARRVVELDRRREASATHIVDLTPAERANADARVGENSLTIAWVSNSLRERCANYRYALEHLSVAEPEPAAAEADRALALLQQKIAANQVTVVGPNFAAAPATVAQ